MKPFKVYPSTVDEMNMFEQLRLMYGFRTKADLCRYVLKKEAEAKGLLQQRVDDNLKHTDDNW